MKIIPKLQKGGGFSRFFTQYQYIFPETQKISSERTSKSSSSDNGELTEKDLFSMLKDLDGLPNEMEALTQSLLASIKLSNLTGVDSGTIASKYISSLYQIKKAKFNKAQFEDARKQTIANNSLNDIAISPSNRVMVQDFEGTIKEVDPEEFAQNKDKYAPLTNSNLLWLRAHDPNYIGNNRLFQITENGIGLESVDRMIKERMSKIGSVETSGETFYKKGSALKGMEVLENMIALGPEGYYKITTDATQSTREQIASALDYIYSTLPANAKTRLKIETQKGTDEDARNLILQRLFSGIDNKQKQSIDFIGSEKKVSGDGSSSGDKSKYNQASMIVLNKGVDTETNIIKQGDSKGLHVLGTKHAIMKSENERLGQATLRQLQRTGAAAVLDFSNASIGDQFLNQNGLDYVYSEDGTLTTVDLPIDQEELQRTGRIKPDLDYASKMEEVQRIIKQNNIPSNDYVAINKILQENHLPAMYDNNGELINTNYTQFAVIHSYAYKNALSDPDGKDFSSWFNKIDEEDRQKEIIRTLNDLNNWTDKTTPLKVDYNDWGWIEGGFDNFVEANVFIPVDNSIIAAQSGKGMSATEAQSWSQRDKEQIQLNPGRSYK